MASKFITFQGKCKWCRMQAPDQFGNWSTRLYFDNASLEKFREMQSELDILTRLKKDDDGYYAQLKRPAKKEYEDTQGRKKTINFTPPTILQRDGVTPHNEGIGDGSDISVEMEIYQYNIPGAQKKGHAIRVHTVRVDNLIPVAAVSALGVPAQDPF